MVLEKDIRAMQKDTSATSVGTSATQIGGDIPRQKTRHILRLTMTNTTTSAIKVSIYAGDSSNNTRKLLDVIMVSANDTFYQKGTTKTPLYSIDAQYDGSTETYNRIYAVATASGVSMSYRYLDE